MLSIEFLIKLKKVEIPRRRLYLYIFIYFLFCFFSGWKATVVNLVFILAIHRLKVFGISIKAILLSTLIFMMMFFIVNFFRGGMTGINLMEPIFYSIFGFYNYSFIASGSYPDCLYSLSVVSGCKFVFDNALLPIPTWNVYTALTPLYIDGGDRYIGVYFLLAGFFLSVSARIKNSIFLNFVYFTSVVFFFYAHNGYLFDSNIYYILAIFFMFFDFIRYKSRVNGAL